MLLTLLIIDQACKLKFRLRELTPCSCSTAALAVCLEGSVAGPDATANELSQPKFELASLILAHCRSSYENAPGGCVCLKREMLQTLYDYAIDYWEKNGVGIMVNALAGSSHSVNSYHVSNNKVWT